MGNAEAVAIKKSLEEGLDGVDGTSVRKAGNISRPEGRGGHTTSLQS